MNHSEESTLADRQLCLPMTAFFSVRSNSERAIAHALDFDLVTTGVTTDEALHKLRIAVRHHVEFGFKNGLSQDEILMKAPQECWDKLNNAPLTLGEDIEIEHYRIKTLTQTVIDDHRNSLTAA